MPKVSTFCPRCGEAIETEVPEEARAAGRAALACPSCRFAFEIAPAERPAAASTGGRPAWEHPAATPHAPASPPPPAAAGAHPPREPDRHESAAAPTRSMKPVAAGMMLIFVAVIGLWLGLTIALDDDLVVEGVKEMSGTATFVGTVRAESGEPLQGVNVTMRPLEGNASAATRETQTTADGRYRFPDTEPGHYLLTFRLANHTTVTLETLAYPEEYQPLFGASGPLTSITMSAGDPAEVEEVSMVDTLVVVTRWMGVAITVAAALAAAGAVAALRRGPFWLAVTGAIAGILTFGFLVGSALALIALVLVILSRREFARPKASG